MRRKQKWSGRVGKARVEEGDKEDEQANGTSGSASCHDVKVGLSGV